MIQLYVNGKLCDVDEDTSIKLEKDFNNKSEHVIDKAEYSFELDLPITKRNREIFGGIDIFDAPNKFSQVYDAILNVDEINIIVGKFMIDEIDDEHYSGNIYVPSSKSLKDVLGDKKMKDIKPAWYDISTWDKIKTIQENFMYNRGRADVVFPYILYKLPYTNTSSTYPITTQDLSASGNTFTMNNIFPAYRVLGVIRDIFEGEGYKIQGNIFEMDKFKELFQTFSLDAKTFNEEKVIPYHLAFSLDYNLRNADNTSSTAQIVELFDEPMMSWGIDAPLLSENTTITEEDDPYNMLIKGDTSNARSLVVPKSGWYYIQISGRMEMPVNSGYWSQDERINVCGRNSDADRTNLMNNIMEFQVKKTSTPLSSPRLYSFNCSTPINPTILSDSNLKYNETWGQDFLDVHYGRHSIVLSYDESRLKFPKNQKTALVKDFSNDDTSEFVCGARWGCQFSGKELSDNRIPDRRSEEMVYTCLPDPRYAQMERYVDDGNVDHMFMTLYSTQGLFKDDSDRYRRDYGSQTAQILVRDDSKSYFEGYNLYKPNQEGSGGTWDTTTCYDKREYTYISPSEARVHSSGFGGGMILHTCVWLEEGDNISIELMMPYHDYRDDCGWLENCDWKHRWRAGVCNTHLNTSFNMDLVSTNKKWNAENILDWIHYGRIQLTNMNQFLGDGKVNDYIENFLTTFNLKLSKVDEKTYSIDTMMADMDVVSNIVDIDKYAHVNDAKFKRIDTSNTKLEWTISTDEEGYAHGNNTKENKTKRDESGYTASKTFNVGSTTKEDKIKSNYSYTWMKDIDFVNGDIAFTEGRKEVPVISDASIWESTFLGAQDEDYATDKTPRYIYMSKDPDSGLYEYFNIVGKQNDSQLTEVKAPLLFCKNYITYKNEFGELETFRLDYDNTWSTKTDKTITDKFYSINSTQQYEIELGVKLPNDVYNKITTNSLVKFNDGLYRVMGIEGHDIEMEDEATLKLITLK